MFYYILPKIGTGTDEDPYRPEILDEISFVSAECRGQFFVVTKDEIVGKIPLSQAEVEHYCYNNRINYAVLLVGGG
ncbi:hypothetical protein [Paenibacillus anseongense]|uniref:hypothetical protein n=1 Tax=Paenibacillus anseongense TaxID=2682845 RepID=UPI002DBA0067|nr:hypothetical protein [Paenibacillus anseongense]MEC0265135.1 hypothetical protein [Paenibacillus anseongense]